MDPLELKTNEELLFFFNRKKTEISCIKQPHTLLTQLRDHDLVPEKLSENVKNMCTPKMKEQAFYEVLDWLEKNRPQDIQQFWRCVFEDHILQQYPTLRMLKNSLLDSPSKLCEKPPDVKTPTEEESEGKTEKGKKKGYTIKRRKDDRRSVDSDDPDLFDIFSVSTPSPTKPDKKPLFCPLYEKPTMESEGKEKKQNEESYTRMRSKDDRRIEDSDYPDLFSVFTLSQKKPDQNPSVSSPVKKEDEQEIWKLPIYKTQLPVTCGNKEGTLYRDKLTGGEKCIFSQECWFTPGDFEKFGGKEKCKNWKSSIRCENTTLKKLIESSENTEVFTPKVCKEKDKDKHKNEYRFECPYAGQFGCSLTSLVFVMEGKGEVLYKTVSWDPRWLDGLGNMEPAGPLYDINCSDGSISGLHLPHCEIFSEEDMGCLAVAHFTGGNVAIMNPLKVTEAHVMIDIKDLSLFGLIKRMIFPPSPVTAQVLVFLRPITEGQRENILDVHLLPWNVPLSEVKDQHVENMHIKTSSKCRLTPGTEYRLRCQPDTFRVQPETDVFEFNFGPNYHPTFEVFVKVKYKFVTLSLMDHIERREVWPPRRIVLTGQEVELPAHRSTTESEFVNKHRRQLIQRVSSVMAIADGLRAKNMITGEIYSKVCATRTRQDRMRVLLDALDSGGDSVKAEFYRLLKENEPHLVNDLDSESQ